MEVVRRVCPHWTPQSHLIKLPLSPMFAYTDNCWDSGRKQLIYNGTENSPARLSWHCSRKDTALSIPGMGFCNAYIPWSPRLLHEQWDFKNPCRWWWVTQAHQELSDHQSCQLHTQSDKACETNGRCGRASLRDHTRHLSLQPQGEGRSELYHVLLGSQGFSKGPPPLLFPPPRSTLSDFSVIFASTRYKDLESAL